MDKEFYNMPASPAVLGNEIQFNTSEGIERVVKLR